MCFSQSCCCNIAWFTWLECNILLSLLLVVESMKDGIVSGHRDKITPSSFPLLMVHSANSQNCTEAGWCRVMLVQTWWQALQANIDPASLRPWQLTVSLCLLILGTLALHTAKNRIKLQHIQSWFDEVLDSHFDQTTPSWDELSPSQQNLFSGGLRIKNTSVINWKTSKTEGLLTYHKWSNRHSLSQINISCLIDTSHLFFSVWIRFPP